MKSIHIRLTCYFILSPLCGCWSRFLSFVEVPGPLAESLLHVPLDAILVYHLKPKKYQLVFPETPPSQSLKF